MPNEPFIIVCPQCKQRNRVKPGVFSKCGKCKKQFTAEDIKKGQLEEMMNHMFSSAMKGPFNPFGL